MYTVFWKDGDVYGEYASYEKAYRITEELQYRGYDAWFCTDED